MIADPTKYAPGTQIYNRLVETYGVAGANYVYNAALTQRDGAVADALGQLNYGNLLESSTWKIFWTQIYNDPFGAPLEQIGTVTENTVKGLTSRWGTVLLVLLIAGGLFLYFGGGKIIKRKFAKA